MQRIRKLKPVSPINAGSMADIAFLLLVFFLVTTTLESEKGIFRKLPPFIMDNTSIITNRRNVYEILVNGKNEILVEGKPMKLNRLTSGIKIFYTNPNNDKNFPELKTITAKLVNSKISFYKTLLIKRPDDKTAVKKLVKWQKKKSAIVLIGTYKELPANAVITLKNDKETTYERYIEVQNELSKALNQLRNKYAIEKFGKPFSDLNPSIASEEKMIKAIRQVYPQRISEANPN